MLIFLSISLCVGYALKALCRTILAFFITVMLELGLSGQIDFTFA